MSTWTVYKYVKENGKCPIDTWLNSKALTDKDRAALDARVMEIDASTELRPERVKLYKGHGFHELKAKGDRKQLRPLCIKDDDKKIIILCGAIEKGGRLRTGDKSRAENLIKDYGNGIGSIKQYLDDDED